MPPGGVRPVPQRRGCPGEARREDAAGEFPQAPQLLQLSVSLPLLTNMMLVISVANRPARSGHPGLPLTPPAGPMALPLPASPLMLLLRLLLQLLMGL